MGAPPNQAENQAPFLEQLKSFGLVYWIANWMELVERFAYYGVRVVLPVFMVAAFEDGGPQLTHVQKGSIYAVWAIVQSFVPILSGGFADRFGYKLNIAISTVLKILGYLVMGYCIVMAESLAGTSLSEARAAGNDSVYEIFFAGAMLLALGTAIFKPGVQGLIANQMPSSSASVGWAVFYQMVNIGGFIGPVLAGYLRVLDWTYVFLACAVGIALNFIPLFFFKEPEKPEGASQEDSPMAILYDAMRGLLEPRLFFFTIAFAGFWLMFYQLFDILPNFIDDWIDSRAVAAALQGILGEGRVPTINGGNLTQEWMLNFNALLISLFAFAMGFATSKVNSLTAIIVGIAISAVAIFGLGMDMSGWWILGAIGLFSVGEMAASPTKMRYLSSIAPPGKQGQYMGYVNFTVGIGWSVGSVVAGELYQKGGDKIVLARKYLEEKLGMAATEVAKVERGDVLDLLYQKAQVDAFGARTLLWDTYEPYSMWLIFTGIGLASMGAIVIYNFALKAAEKKEDHPFNFERTPWVTAALVPIVATFLYFTVTKMSTDGLTQSLGLLLNTVFFAAMLIISVSENRTASK